MTSADTGREDMHFLVFLLLVQMQFFSKSISEILSELISPLLKPSVFSAELYFPSSHIRFQATDTSLFLWVMTQGIYFETIAIMIKTPS